MSKKPGRKGKAAPTRQQQQEAAARRRAGGGQPAASRASAVQAPAQATRPRPSPQPAVREQADRHYLDVSVVRIQDWLGRTPALKFRRGGSVLLSQWTGRDAWPDDALPARTRWNAEAGDLDGVVSLVLCDGVPEHEAGAVLSAAARQVASVLRDKLPFCPVQAVAGSGDCYAVAFGELERARSDGAFLVDSPAPAAELILAKPCDQCRAAPAEHEKVLAAVADDGKPPDLCADCLLRVEPAGGTKGDSQPRSPRPERRMRAALAEAGMTVAGFPDNFAELALLGRRDADDTPTQLGLIYADSNRVGAFLGAAAAQARAHGSPAKSEIVTAVDNAVLAALADAVLARFEGGDRPPVLAHLAGGDDLLISVPAGDAWPFTRALLLAFSDRIGRALDWPAEVRALLPSVSAGLVFHHLKAPFPDVVRLVHDQLVAAKKATAGRQASVAFLDLTADGDVPPCSRKPLTVRDLERQASRLTEIATTSRSHRENIIGLERLAQADQSSAGTDRTGETPVEALARRVIDLGCRPIWDAVLGRSGATASEVRAALTGDPAARDELRRTLDLARWWPPASVAGAPEIGAGTARIPQEAQA